jgi:[protein-PII] uridylyltransferase
VVGQLHRITQALADCALDVNSAKVSTFGSAVVDAFYVRGPDGGKVTDSRRIASVEAAIRSRVAQTGSTGVH